MRCDGRRHARALRLLHDVRRKVRRRRDQDRGRGRHDPPRVDRRAQQDVHHADGAQRSVRPFAPIGRDPRLRKDRGRRDASFRHQAQRGHGQDGVHTSRHNGAHSKGGGQHVRAQVDRARRGDQGQGAGEQGRRGVLQGACAAVRHRGHTRHLQIPRDLPPPQHDGGRRGQGDGLAFGRAVIAVTC